MPAPDARRGGAPRITTARAPASQPASTARSDARSRGVTSARPNITPITTAHAARRQVRPTHGATAVATPAPTATASWVASGLSTNQSRASTVRPTGGDVGSSTSASSHDRTSAIAPPTAAAPRARQRSWATATTAPPTKAARPVSHVRASTAVTSHDGSWSSPRSRRWVSSTAVSPASHCRSRTTTRLTAATPTRRMSAGDRSAATGGLSCTSTTTQPGPRSAAGTSLRRGDRRPRQDRVRTGVDHRTRW